MMASNLPSHFSFSGIQEQGQKLSKDSPDGTKLSLDVRDRRSQISDDSNGHFHRPLNASSTVEYEPIHANVALLKAELKAITNDRDILRRELSKMQSQLESYQQLGFSSVEKLAPHHSYEWLKSQCDQAMSELQSLKELHSDTVKKCDSAMNRADLYKQQYEKAKDNNAMMRSQYAEAMAERQHLEDERHELRRLNEVDRREIDELRKQQHGAIGQGTSFDEFSVVYDKLVNRYDVLKKDYEALRKQYNDSVSAVGSASAKVEAIQEENVRLRKQNGTLYEDKKSLQHHLSHNLLNFGLEKKSIVHELTKTQQEKEAVEQRLSQVLAEKLKEMKDLNRLRNERNEAYKEYKLVMSERDTVHKEMEQLQDVITELNGKVATLVSEKSSAVNEVSRLRQMLRSTRDNFCDASEGRNLELEQEKILHDFDQMLERTSSDKESFSPYSSNNKEVLGPFSRDNNSCKELEMLRKDLEKAQNELMDALHDLEEAKQQRDWAFGERDKIVKERESIRTLCDKVRHERDSAVSELIDALRDSDELKRQKTDVMKELKELKEKYEALAEKEAQSNRLSAKIECSHSRDSAIDADLQEWETETLEFDIGKIHSSDLGFDLVGGASDPQFPNGPSVFVRSIQPSSAAYGKLKVSDQLLRVNDIDVSCEDKAYICQVLRNSPDPVHIVVRRRRLTSSRAVFPIHIYRSGDRDIGISLEQGFYVNRLMSGSLAAKEGSLAIGDRILSINGFALENCSALEAMQFLSEAGDHIVLNVLRYCQTPSSSLVSSASMFSGTNFETFLEGSGGFRSPLDSSWKSPPNELSSCMDGKTATLRSSSSQTDGLSGRDYVDPRIGGFERGPNNSSVKKGGYEGMDEQMHDKNIFDKAMNVIARPFRSSRAMRDMRSKSTHPFVNASTIEAWRRQEECNLEGSPSPQKLVDMPPSPSSATKLKRKSHGTWPKCRMHFDYAEPSEPVVHSGTERPCLSQVVRGGANVLPSSSAEHKIPPLPPTRSDSIKRSASVKHSPQSSDSTVKYSSMKGSIAGTMQRLDRSASDAFHSSEAGQAFMVDSRPSVIMTSESQEIAYHESTPADHRAVSPSSISSYNPVKDHKAIRYVCQNPGSRTGNSEYRSDRRSQDFGQHSSDLWTAQAQKPTSLNVHPMYSTRPSKNQAEGFLWMPDFNPEMNLSSVKPSVGDAHQRLMPGNVPWNSKKSLEPALPIMSASPGIDQTASYLPHGTIHQLKTFESVVDSLSTAYPVGQCLIRRSPVSPVSLMPLSRTIGPSIPETPDLELSSSSNKDDSQASSSPLPMVSSLYHQFHPPASSVKLPPQPNDLSGELFSLFARSGNQFHERIRIPSSPSIMSSRSSAGGISSPSSYDAITDYLSSVAPYTLPHRTRRHPPVVGSNSLPKMVQHEKLSRARPRLGDTRSITVEINNEPLGIRIDSSRDGGIFVSYVGEDSAATRAGIEIGDQLLEVCGINMRNATKPNATRILRQCIGTIEMLVQYNPDKYREQNFTDSDDPSEDDSANSKAPHDNFSRGSGSSRARASNATITPETFMTHATFSHSSVNADEASSSSESHVIMRKKLRPHDSLGIELVGGNVIGIFIKHVLPGSLMGGPKGLRIGDQILEFNSRDFHGLTLEQAILEIGKPCEQVICRVHYNFPLFLRTESQSGDGFYVRTLYNRQATSNNELSFKRDDILFIENTVLNGRIGTWWAYLVNENGDKLKCGTIPSKSKLEEELSHKRSLVDVSSCQATGTVRRSFFQRHRHHNGSKESHDLNLLSDASLNSDSIHHLDDLPPPTLERIQKFDNSILRPVIIIGAFAEQIVKKLTSESPNKFCKYDTDMMMNDEDSNLIEYRTSSDGMYKVVSIVTVQQIMNLHRHCLLAVPPEVVERLQKAHIYPIVLFIKYKSQKQIREVKDACFIPEKVSSKMAKDLFEQNQDYEQKFKRLFAEMIPGGNLALMCCQIKLVIDKEQKKTLWIPSSAYN